MEKKCLDVRVNVKPIFCMLSHKYYYEGPCRMAGGDALQPGFDDILNGQISNGILKGLGFACPEDVGNVMEAVCTIFGASYRQQGSRVIIYPANNI